MDAPIVLYARIKLPNFLFICQFDHQSQVIFLFLLKKKLANNFLRFNCLLIISGGLVEFVHLGCLKTVVRLIL